MGNCQAAEAATVLIQRPGGGVERIYWSVSAREVMSSNPGHYVAMVVAPTADGGAAVKQLKLLRPDDTLRLGQVYRLVSFQEFAAKKKKMKKEEGVFVSNSGAGEHRIGSSQRGSGNSNNNPNNRRHCGQWKPALQTIAELGNEKKN